MHADSTELSRRAFLAIAGAVPLAWAAGSLRLYAAGPIPVALQMYSVRRDCAANFDAALEQVAAMGFAGVEFAGYYTYAGKGPELAARLKALNLKPAGTHVQMTALRGDALKATIDFHQAIGCKFLICPMDADMVHPEKSRALADEFNQLAQTLKPLGMACGYHNHKPEWQKDGDKFYFDLFAERTTKDVILQQDCGWTMAAGQDPAAVIRKYPGRIKTTHFKPTVREGDTGKKAIFGQDSVDWKSVYAACKEAGGTEWIVLEQEVYPDGKSPMDCTRESFAGLKGILS
jgi:sugar phosphate isomerase/epimerase